MAQDTARTVRRTKRAHHRKPPQDIPSPRRPVWKYHHVRQHQQHTANKRSQLRQTEHVCGQ